MSVNVSGQVGIETSDPKVTLDVNAALSLREGGEVILMNGKNSAINLGVAPYSFYQINGPTESFFIEGILPVANSDGQIVTLQNNTNETMYITHLATGVDIPNQIIVANEKQFRVIGKYSCISFLYNKVNNKWYLLNKLNHTETWYYPPTKLSKSSRTTLTGLLPGVTKFTGFSVNIVGPSAGSMDEDLVIEYKETRNGELIFRVWNKSRNTDYIDVQFAMTVYNDY